MPINPLHFPRSLLAATVAAALAPPALAAGETTRVSVASNGGQANDSSGQAGSHVFSADGRFVAFTSGASNLVPGDTNGKGDVFVHDRLTKKTTRVSVASDGTQGNGTCYISAISADGRFVAFSSTSTNLVPGDTNGVMDAFVRDPVTHTTTRVSVASDGTQGNGYGIDRWLDISADGRFVTFFPIPITWFPKMSLALSPTSSSMTA